MFLVDTQVTFLTYTFEGSVKDMKGCGVLQITDRILLN